MSNNLFNEAKKLMNDKREFANIKLFLHENNDKMVALTSNFFNLYSEVGKQGNDATQKLRQFTFIFSYLMALIKVSGIPKDVKQELINELQKALNENQL